jgi:VanZ family protein
MASDGNRTQRLTQVNCRHQYEGSPAGTNSEPHETDLPDKMVSRLAGRMIRLMVKVLCLLVLAIILTAGLWPFHGPWNAVSWLSEDKGLRFGRHGSVVTEGPLGVGEAKAANSCTLELWLEPARLDLAGTILAFYDSASGMVPFALRQFQHGLAFRRVTQDSGGQPTEIYVPDVFSGRAPVFVTIRSGEHGTSVSTDGKLLKRVPYFSFSSQDLSGQMVVGDAPIHAFGWLGTVKGLAIYHRELTDDEVARESDVWTKSGRPNSTSKMGLVASYPFDEGRGTLVHNQVESAANLMIPGRFMVLHKVFLQRPWDEFSNSRHYWKDVAINVVGFIPLGLVFRGYFAAILGIKRSTWLTIAFGFAVSLTIEVLQSYLPTRDSGMTDIITNTSGTALGAISCAWLLKNSRFAKLIASVDGNL